jgi:hypothetical protein
MEERVGRQEILEEKSIIVHRYKHSYMQTVIASFWTPTLIIPYEI